MAVSPAAALKSLQKALTESIASALDETARSIEREASSKAPVRTGRLRAGTQAKSFTPAQLQKRGQHRLYATFRKVGGESTYYGTFIDRQTGFLKKPFVREADELPRRMDREFEQRVRSLPDIRIR